MPKASTRIIFIGLLLVSGAFGRNASDDAIKALIHEWTDPTSYQEWDPQTKRPGATSTPASQHCLTALDLATRAQPDKEGALQELLTGLDVRLFPNAYSLPPELQGKIWDWLATAAKSFSTNAEHGIALDHAKSALDGFYVKQKANLLVVHSDIQKKNDPRALFGLLELAVDPTLMEEFRHCYATDKQKLFNYVEAKFK